MPVNFTWLGQLSKHILNNGIFRLGSDPDSDHNASHFEYIKSGLKVYSYYIFLILGKPSGLEIEYTHKPIHILENAAYHTIGLTLI